MSKYLIGDFLIRIKNASLAGKKDLVVRKTRGVSQVVNVLKNEGFIDSYINEDGQMKVVLSYIGKRPKILDIKLVSKPGLRVYLGADEIAARREASILIVSTSTGIVSSREAKRKRLGGEIIAEVW